MRSFLIEALISFYITAESVAVVPSPLLPQEGLSSAVQVPYARNTIGLHILGASEALCPSLSLGSIYTDEQAKVTVEKFLDKEPAWYRQNCNMVFDPVFDTAQFRIRLNYVYSDMFHYLCAGAEGWLQSCSESEAIKPENLWYLQRSKVSEQGYGLFTHAGSLQVHGNGTVQVTPFPIENEFQEASQFLWEVVFFEVHEAIGSQKGGAMRNLTLLDSTWDSRLDYYNLHGMWADYIPTKLVGPYEPGLNSKWWVSDFDAEGYVSIGPDFGATRGSMGEHKPYKLFDNGTDVSCAVNYLSPKRGDWKLTLVEGSKFVLQSRYGIENNLPSFLARFPWEKRDSESVEMVESGHYSTMWRFRED